MAIDIYHVENPTIIEKEKFLKAINFISKYVNRLTSFPEYVKLITGKDWLFESDSLTEEEKDLLYTSFEHARNRNLAEEYFEEIQRKIS